jgi:hypothetical protein
MPGELATSPAAGFAPSEQVAITFRAEVLTTTKATTEGDVAYSFPAPSGWAPE